MDVARLLERIGYSGPRAATPEVLCDLHLGFLEHVPFENLDVVAGRTIELDPERFWAKVVDEGRGGFCYELNGLFAALLEELGFRVDLVSARVFAGAGDPTPEFDHLALIVHLERRHLADVGFGDSFLRPLFLDQPGEQTDGVRAFRVDADGSGQNTLWKRSYAGGWQPSYVFAERPRRLAEFAERCLWQQVSPESHFRRGRFVSRATESAGRVTLSERHLVHTDASGAKRETPIEEPDFPHLLRKHFGLF